MTEYRLRLHLLSDATFGRGDGLAGVVDAEVQHDNAGLPYLAGRTLKGLLGAECADIVYAVGLKSGGQTKWAEVGARLFGKQGSALDGEARLRVGPAQLPADLRQRIAQDVADELITRSEVLESLTAIRRQTAMDKVTGAPLDNTLRSMRVILRDTPFEAVISLDGAATDDATADALALLAACVKALRRAGTGRNRGRGRLTARLCDANGHDVTETCFVRFREAMTR